MDKPQHLLNNQIRANKILLLDDAGDRLGEFSYQEAMRKADDQDFDLVQFGQKKDDQSKDVAICRILKYDSWLYHENKRKQKIEFNNRSQEMKAMNFRPGIGENDFQIKIKKISEFLDESHRVKIIIKLKSREWTMKNVNDALVQKITDALKEHANMDSKVSWSPKEINFIMKPEKKAVAKPKM